MQLTVYDGVAEVKGCAWIGIRPNSDSRGSSCALNRGCACGAKKGSAEITGNSDRGKEGVARCGYIADGGV